MDELPWWLTLRDPNSVYASVVRELWQDPAFAQQVSDALNAPDAGQPFFLSIGGRDIYDSLPDAARRGVPWNEDHGAVTMYGEQDGTAVNAGIAVDVDRILAAVQGDSAQARQLVRDALIHEFGHVMPVARSRSMSDRTFDPKPGDPNAAQHPVIQNENKLRGLLGLPSKTFYGLLGKR